MKTPYTTEWPSFYTATICGWKPLLADNNFKDIITDSLRFLVKEQRIVLNAFVIMNNHIHIIWQPKGGHTKTQVQLSFMRYTSQQIKQRLEKADTELLETFKVHKGDRLYQIWKRESLSIELFTPAVFYQKLNYIHDNPVRAGLCKHAEDYHYSSSSFYHTGIDKFNMLSHYL